VYVSYSDTDFDIYLRKRIKLYRITPKAGFFQVATVISARRHFLTKDPPLAMSVSEHIAFIHSQNVTDYNMFLNFSKESKISHSITLEGACIKSYQLQTLSINIT